jgi:hypothetical protein
MAPQRRTLVFCRVGETSLHRTWIGDPAARSYDVWLDCWCDPARWAGEPARVTDGRGTTKWPRIATLLAREPEAFAPYDVVWFPDDDLDIAPPAVEEFFAIFRRHGLALAQPALADGCYWNHEVTLANRGFVLRHTNFVEVMAPAFSREALVACAPTFGQSVMGWGLDLAWSRVLGDPRAGISVVDATTMIHTRPLGAAGSYHLGSAEDEMRAVAARYGVPVPFEHRHHGGVVRRADGGDGPDLPRGLRFTARLVAGAPASQRWHRRYWEYLLRSLRGTPEPTEPAPRLA